MQNEFIDKVKALTLGKNLKYYIMTMGCQLNENDSEKIVGMVEQMGYSKSEDIKKADLYLINTCCVRENAEEKLFGKIGELKNSTGTAIYRPERERAIISRLGSAKTKNLSKILNNMGYLTKSLSGGIKEYQRFNDICKKN